MASEDAPPLSTPEPPLSLEDEARLAAFHARASSESSRLAAEAVKQKTRHAELRVRFGAEAVEEWYSEHQAVLDEEAGVTGAPGGATHLALAATSALGPIPPLPPRRPKDPRSPAAEGLRIRAVWEGAAEPAPLSETARAAITPVSPAGTPYDEAIELPDDEPELLDAFGAPLSGPAAAVAGVTDYQMCVLCYRRFEAWGRIVESANAFPDSPMLQLLAADYLQAKAGGSGPAGDERLSAADQLPLEEREKGYLEALRATASAEWRRAYAAWLLVVKRWPTDLFAVKRGQFVCLMMGEANGMLEVARAARPGDGALGRYYYGLLAFGLEQTGQYQRAEAAAQEGLAGEFDAGIAEEDAWLQHGLAHALYFQARHADALAFLHERSSKWSRDALHPFLYTHLWWHLALLQASHQSLTQPIPLALSLLLPPPSPRPSAPRCPLPADWRRGRA